MSGSKSGEFTLAPLALPIVVAAAGVAAAVDAYIAARERIRREREKAISEQRAELGKALEEWRNRMAASAKKMTEPRTPVRTRQEIVGGMLSALPESSSLRAEDYLKDSFDGADAQPPHPDSLGKLAVERGRKVIDSIQGILDALAMPLPKDVAPLIRDLHREQDIASVASIAEKIRISINREEARMREEQQEARAVLDGLPPDFPAAARDSLSEVANGRSRFDNSLREFLHESEKQMMAGRRLAAAKILNDTLSGLGYEVEPVGGSLFADGGDLHFRNSGWEDGYCVKLNVEGNRIGFDVQKVAASGRGMDEAVEREWEGEFAEVREKLGEAGIRITSFSVDCEPGAYEVPVNRKITIDTRKKGRKKAAAAAQQSRTGVRR